MKRRGRAHVLVKDLELDLCNNNNFNGNGSSSNNIDSYSYSSSSSGIAVSSGRIAQTFNTVPGFRTSAAFFTFLRANLVLPPSSLNSTTSTPLLDPSSSQTLPPLQPSSLATMTSLDNDPPSSSPPSSSNPLDDIPPLITTTLTTPADKTLALKLIADSIAQQRQLASRALLSHPLSIALYIGLLAILSRVLYRTSADLGLVITTGAGITMACLVAVRGLTAGYIQFAEEMNFGFTQADDGDEDTIIGSRFGEEMIGALILRLERGGGSPNGKKKMKGSSGKGGAKGVIRAWTVRMRFRGKGVGTELLEEAVRVAREWGGGGVEVGFAREHANSRMVLWEGLNGGFRKRERRAAGALERVVEGLRRR